MLLTQIYVFLALFSRGLFDSLVFEPDQPPAKTTKEELVAWEKEIEQVLGTAGRTGFKLKLIRSVNLLSDILLVVGLFSFKFLPARNGFGCILLGCLFWISIVYFRFDFSAKEVTYNNDGLADPTGIEFKDPKPTEPAAACCAVCGELLVGQIVMCKKCETPHHKDCWKYLGKCSVYGCGGRYSRNQTRKEIIATTATVVVK